MQNKKNHIHFIGICGAGMSAVAKLCQDLGYIITGSDEGFYPPISDYLIQNNIVCKQGHKKENLLNANGEVDVDVVVIGKHAKLVPEGNEEVAYVFELQKEGKIIIKSFPELLSELTKEKENIVVAGSYGKSTCTTLLSWILENAGEDPGYFIGANPLTPITNANFGSSKNFILEGDEYPSANFDNRSKFLHYNAHDVLLTALTHDHVNVFKTLEDYQKPFFDLIKNLPTEGNLVVCLDNKEIQEQIKYIHHWTKANVMTYSLENNEADYFAKNISFGDITTFDLYKSIPDPSFIKEGSEELLIKNIETTLLGKHNLQNIIGVVALILEKSIFEKGEVTLKIKAGIKNFKGLKRRLDLLNEGKNVQIYEGFGTSYEKARAAVEAINLHFPNKKMTIVFEPHTFSWRNREAIHWYDDVFAEADKVFVYAPPSHGAATHAQLTQDEIIERIKMSQVFKDKQENVFKITEKDSGVKSILENLDSDSVILILTSGDLGGIIKELVEKVK
jgi:UDP-N-acetylmuramate: L-alanyl-gamma-D-glutamyl-meso-diaminopimelate ligase